MESTKEKTVIENGKVNTTEVAEYIDFDRVNFDIPATIATYGSKEMAKTREILAQARGMIGNSPTVDPEFVKQLSTLTGFSSRLEVVEEEKNKLEKYEADKAKATGLQKITLALTPKPGKNIVDYKTLHQEAADGVDYIVKRFDEKKNETLTTINMRSAIASQLGVSGELLKKLHEVGLQDAEKYNNEVIIPLEKACSETNDENLKGEFLLKKEMLNQFKGQLYSIQTHINVIYASINQLGIQSGTDLLIVRKYQDYIQNSSISLELQCFVMVESIHQRENQKEIMSVMNATNGIIESNGDIINDNVAGAVKMMEQGSLDINVLKKLGTQITSGIKLYNDGIQLVNQAREKNAVELAKLNIQLESMKDGLAIEAQQAIAEGLQSDNGYSRALRPSAPSKKKRLFDDLLNK